MSSRKRKSSSKDSPPLPVIIYEDDSESFIKNRVICVQDSADMYFSAAMKKDTDFHDKYLIQQSKILTVDGNNSSNASTSNPIHSLDLSKKLCITPGCKRKCGSLCSFGLCVACCIQTTDNGEKCASHLSARHRKEDEDRWAAQGVVALLNEGHKRGGRLHTKFYHFEEKFMSFGQTVVIWCFADFCRHKEWSGDTFAQGMKEQALRARRRRRLKSSWSARKTSSAIPSSSNVDPQQSSSALPASSKPRSRKSQAVQQLPESQASSSSLSAAADESQGNLE